MSDVDTDQALTVLRWWARPTQSFFGAPRIRDRVMRNHVRVMRGMRDGRLDEIARALRSNVQIVDWSEVDRGLPPPEAVHPTAVTWDGAVDGVTAAARLVGVSRFGDALQYLYDAERLVGDGPLIGRAVLVAAQGRCRHLLGDGEGALRAAETALGLLVTTGSGALVAEASLQALRTRGTVRDESDIPEDLRRAWSAFVGLQDRPGGADCLLEQATRELRGGRAEVAATTAAKAAEVLDDHDGWSALACEIAVARCVASARHAGARATAKLAKRLRNEILLLDDPWWSWQVDCAVADAALDEGDRRAARQPLRSSMRSLERLRFRVGDVGQRAGWLTPRLRPFVHGLDAALHEHRHDQVLEIAERIGRSALAHTLLARATQADREMSLQASRLLAVSDAPGGRSGREILDAAAERDSEVIASLARRNAVLAAMVRPDAEIDVAALLHALGGGPFLSLLEASGRVWRVWGDRDGVHGADVVELSADAEEPLTRLVDDDAGRLKAWIWSAEGAAAVARLGPSLLPAPLVDALEPDVELTIVAGGRLARVPYPALDAGGRPLVERCELGTTPSLGLVAALRSQRRVVPAAGPVLLAPEPRGLHGSARQVELLQDVWPNAMAAEGPTASLENLARLSQDGALAAATALVVAAHGEAHPVDPLRSGVRLGDGRILSAGSVLSLHLPQHVELWSCSSAGEAAVGGPEMSGLMASCLAAGARRVLGSLWPLPDEDAAVLAAGVHRNLSAGCSLARALARAQRELLGRLPLLSWGAPSVSGLTDEAARA